MMSIDRSIELFGTSHFATSLMLKAIVVEGSKIDLVTWLTIIPSEHLDDAVAVAREVLTSLDPELSDHQLKNTIIQNIQDLMHKRVRPRSWWYYLNKR